MKFRMVLCAAMMLTASFVATTASAGKCISSEKKYSFLYEVEYSDIDYKVAKQFYDKYGVTARKPACSGVRNGNFHGRNFDWACDSTMMYVIHVPAKGTRHASVGVANIPRSSESLTKEMLTFTDEELLKYMPYSTFDGINDAGVVIQENMVNADQGSTYASNPSGEELHAGMVVRYILDNAGSVDEAIEILKSKNVKMFQCFDLHWFISDKNKSAAVEFVNNEIKVDTTARIMTNFYVTLPYYENTSIGIERYEILKTWYPEGNTLEGMKNLMDRARYGKFYSLSERDMWVSEYNGDKDAEGNTCTIFNSKGRAAKMVEDTKHQPFAAESKDRVRDGSLYQTVTCSVFDIAEKKMYVRPQEDDVWFEFGLTK